MLQHLLLCNFLLLRDVKLLAICCVLPPDELRCICTAVECYRRWLTTSDAIQQNNTGPYTMCRRASNTFSLIYQNLQSRFGIERHPYAKSRAG